MCQEHCFLILEFRQFVFSQRAVSNLFLEPLCGLTIRPNIIYGGTVTYGLFIIVQLKSSVGHGCYPYTPAPREGILDNYLVLCKLTSSECQGCAVLFNNSKILLLCILSANCQLNLECFSK